MNIEKGWMDTKLALMKYSGISITELKRLNVFEFFTLLNQVQEQAENGRRD